MSDLIDVVLGLVLLLTFAWVVGHRFNDNPFLIAVTDGDLYEEGDA